MVFSDTHLYDASLGTSGAAWDAYMAADRKLLADSEETLRVAFEQVRRVRPGFVLVTGDLTKDGEELCHEKFASYLKGLADAGIQAYVIPGNHDIDNPDAARFLPAGGTERVPSVSPGDFARIYAAYGYDQAIARDPASLSYVASPAPGLWLLLLDSARYERNEALHHPETSGAIRPATFAWIRSRLEEADRLGVAVIAAEHHPLMEHFAGMKAKYPEYVIDDNWKLAALLAAHNVRMIFTGHYHASSIVEHRWEDSDRTGLAGRAIVDVETGSLVTWPCSFRTVQLGADGSLDIRTSRVEQLPSYARAGKSFDVEGRRIIGEGIGNIAATTMNKFRVAQHDIETLTPEIVEAMMAHYKGDAHFPGGDMLTTRGLGLMGRLVVASYNTFVKGLWKTVPPKGVELMEDNDIRIAADGSWAAELPRP